MVQRILTWIRGHIYWLLLYMALSLGNCLYLDIPLWLSCVVNGGVLALWAGIDIVFNWLKGWHGSRTKTLVSGGIRAFLGILFWGIGAWNVYRLMYTEEFWIPLLGSIVFLFWGIHALKIDVGIRYMYERWQNHREQNRFWD